jgi:hypothetical protein
MASTVNHPMPIVRPLVRRKVRNSHRSRCGAAGHEARSAKVTLGELITRNSRSKTGKKSTAWKARAHRGNVMAFGGLSLSPQNGSRVIDNFDRDI